MSAGLWAAIAAYGCWGLFPLYLKHLAHVSPLEVVMHRSWWSLLLVLALLAAARRLGALRDAARSPRLLLTCAATAVLLTTNWLVYVWAVVNDRVVDASLGYFINPLVNVLLGYVVLRERPRALQWAAIGCAACGVLWLGVSAGHWPWVSLALGISFGFYGLLRKTAPVGAAEGLALETAWLAPLALGGMLWLAARHEGHFGQGDFATDALLLAAGPATAVPLLLFAMAARRVSLTTLGLLQYLAPSIQFALGVWLYREPFGPARAVGFAAIWLGLLLYSGEGLLRWRRRSSVAAQA
ncbi:MAG: EamA family transporter RarD [Burkholderiaceae bacterium]